MTEKSRLAILGTGNIGASIANGLVQSGRFGVEQVTLTRRKSHLLDTFAKKGYAVHSDNKKAVAESDIIILAVEPQQLNDLLDDIGGQLDSKRHLVISVVSGVSVGQIKKRIGKPVTVVRAMPNTAVAIRESMTCLVADRDNPDAIDAARSIFETVGKTMVIDEDQMIAATALGACGVAFFLRAIRSASQGGIEIGFHSGEALAIAAQTARGAASLLLSADNHPEHEIDRVTTPRGCTIAGLNQMEHEGFSSAMIKGIVTSGRSAAKLYKDENG